MPGYSKGSNEKLNTCHSDLQTIFSEVVKTFDNTIVYGRRLDKEQFELFKKGRTKLANGNWVISNKGKVVTFKDGYKKKSRHQPKVGEILSDAVDAVPYPIEWNNTKRMLYFIGVVKGVAFQLKKEGKITHEIITGVDWDNDTFLKDHKFSDYPHFQIVRK